MLLALALVVLSALPSFAGVPPNTQIVNQAVASYSYAGRELTNTSNVDLFVANPQSAKPGITLYRYADSTSADISTVIAVTRYASGSSTGTASAITPPVDLSTPTPLHADSYFHAGQPLYLVITDRRGNLNALAADSVSVRVTSSTGDTEYITLTETGANSGIFAGYLPTAVKTTAGATQYNGVLTVADGAQITAQYQEAADSSQTVTASALVDPTGRVFDSVTGLPVDGAEITLVSVNGEAPEIKGDDGVSAFPATLTTGSVTLDERKTPYDFGPGAYRFPMVAPGTYRLKVVPPKNYRAPSTIADARLQTLVGAPYALSDASRGAEFTVNPGPIILIDIPLDPIVTGLWLQKLAGKATAAVGDFVPFSISVTNTSATAAASGIVITDHMPPGLRYRRGSLKAGGIAVSDPAISPDGSTLTFSVSDLPPGEGLTVSYVTEVTPAARPGTVTNTATASGPHLTSNLASASVKIVEDLFTSRSILMGSVTEGVCGEGTGLAGARIYLEDGTFVVTDKKGLYHFEGVNPGTHVVQLDLDSLPEGYQVLPCEENNRFAGSAVSQFVDIQGGVLWRSDFHVVKPGAKGTLEAPKAAAPAPKAPAVQAPAVAPAPAPAQPVAVPAAAAPVQKTAAVPAATVPPKAPAQPKVQRQPVQGEAGLELSSSVAGMTVSYAAKLFGGSLPLGNMRLSVTLPSEVSYIPGTARVEGAPVSDPHIEGSVLTFPLTAADGKWTRTVRFRAALKRDSQAGGKETAAKLSFDAPDGAPLSTPTAVNRLAIDKNVHMVTLPEIVLHPHFAPLEAELAADDRARLDELAENLSQLSIAQITVTGHTDNWRINRHKRSLYADNQALSVARAEAVGRYLLDKLKLAPGTLTIHGRGESVPISTNNTAKGRAYNRRVQIRVLAEKRLETSQLKLLQEDSGVVKTTFSALAPEEAAAPAVTSAPKVTSAPEVAAVPAPVAPEPTAINEPDAADDESDADARTAAPARAPASVGKAAAPAPAPVPASAPAVAAAPTHVAPPAAQDEDDAEEAAASVPAQKANGEKEGDAEQVPMFDMAWLENAQAGREWVWPPEVYFPSITSTHIAVKHHPGDTVSVTVNGEKVHPVLLEKVLKHPNGALALSYWRGVPLKYGDNKLVATVVQRSGEKTVLERLVHVSTAPVKAEVVPELSHLVADGKTPPVIALRLLDKDDSPARQGVAGKFSISAPYEPFKKLADNMGNDPLEKDGVQYLVGKEGVALIKLQPTSRSGEAVLTLPLNDREEQYRVWLTPQQREWILVGLAEGTAGYNTLSGHLEGLREAGAEDGLYEDGRLAFFAKGTVKGKWLLTMAFDSAKDQPAVGNGLFQTIDPNAYYTLYGDATLQQKDAPSVRKLYLKIERDRFYALFGDYDTGMTVTELSRYSRTMNGIKTEYQGRNLEVNAFGSENGQVFVKNEIQGDGTSGLYHLTRRNVALNTEKIVIQTRDRYRSEIVLSEVPLARFTDYTIDYDAGTIFFKAPVPSRDDNFNPVFIVVDYETQNQGKDSLTFGGRVGAKLLDETVKTGISYVHEGQLNASGNLYGVDGLWQVTKELRLRGEAARTDTDFAGENRGGNSYLLEAEKRSNTFNGRLYYRELGLGFGLGQQSAAEAGTRKMGIDATYKLKETLSLNEQAYRQYNLSTGAKSDVVEGKALYTGDVYTASVGMRYANDLLADGTSKASEQLTGGVSWLTLNKKLNLHVDHEQSLAGNANANFPTRTTLGADYKITPKTVLTAQQELTFGEDVNTSSTRLGLKSNPWEGGAFNTGMQRSMDENGARIFALMGLKQIWKLNEKWSVDGGLDRSQSVKGGGAYTVNGNVPPASGAAENFTAVSLGTNYQEKMWSSSSRVELRLAESGNKWGLFTSVIGELAPGWGGSTRLQLNSTDNATGEKKLTADLRFGVAYRPATSRWILLDRLDLIIDSSKGGTVASDTVSRRLVNNLNANYKGDGKLQLSLQYGAKYVLETIDGARYSGYTDLMGVESRYDVTKKWDIGMRGSMLHGWGTGTVKYSAGPSVGCSVMTNAWVSVGYNLTGFNDKDFSAAEYTAQGPYLRFRLKFDQHSVKEALKWVNQ